MAWSYVSPSQIENYRKCKRSWYLKSILKLPEPQKGHQALGESFHLIVEKVPKGLPWPHKSQTGATDEEWDKAEQLAKLALPIIPADAGAPKPILREHNIRLETYENGPVMVGYIDLAIPPGVGWRDLLIPPNEAIVADYKTLSDFRYMKTPEELANGVQMMTYAKWAVSEVGFNADQVRLLHLYAKTRPPFSRSSLRNQSAIVSRAEVETYWGKTLDTIREMEQTATCGSYEDVFPDGTLNGHCEAYGGCAFRDKCGIGGASTIGRLFNIAKKPTPTEAPEMSGSAILAKIQAARAAAQGQTTQAQSTPPAVASNSANTESANANANTSSAVIGSGANSQPVIQETQVGPKVGEPSPAKTTGPISGLLAKIAAQGKGQPALGGSVAQAYNKETGSTADGVCGVGELGATTIYTVGDLMKLASGVVPPDAPARTQPVITTPGTPVADPETVMSGGNTEDSSDESSEDTPQPVAHTLTTTNEPAKKRGRPSKEEIAAREAAERKRFEDAVAAEVAKRVSTGGTSTVSDPALQAEIDRLKKEIERLRSSSPAPTSTSSPASDGPTLYIDCYPVKGAHPEGIIDFFEWIQPIAHSVAESNGVKDYRLIQYNSKGLLATHIRELVRAEGMPKAMTIPTYAAGADVAMEILIPLAKRVIRKLS